MKKSSFESIRTALTNYGYDNEEILAELDKEINRGAEEKAKNAETYEAIKPTVMDALESPVTISEVWDAVKDDMPEGITKSKVQYAITRLWKDEIKVTIGKPNTYQRA